MPWGAGELVAPLEIGQLVGCHPGTHQPVGAVQPETVGQRDVSRLDRAIALFDRSGARPYAARVRCERALITRDAAEMEAGLAVLDGLGDAEQRMRFERLQVG